ncbi:MAG: hypothetical protein M2R45_05491 [Verrucomicrobia subdivision 3 bacterium]|nr:hypothetical protein [Limisphaerales bacterium]MCS1414516.1 hypothetical protein [Limisphaerales bacterium]
MAKFLGVPSSSAQGGQVFSHNRFGQSLSPEEEQLEKQRDGVQQVEETKGKAAEEK